MSLDTATATAMTPSTYAVINVPVHLDDVFTSHLEEGHSFETFCLVKVIPEPVASFVYLFYSEHALYQLRSFKVWTGKLV
jgi:hypothetical protein